MKNTPIVDEDQSQSRASLAFIETECSMWPPLGFATKVFNISKNQ